MLISIKICAQWSLIYLLMFSKLIITIYDKLKGGGKQQIPPWIDFEDGRSLISEINTLLALHSELVTGKKYHDKPHVAPPVSQIGYWYIYFLLVLRKKIYYHVNRNPLPIVGFCPGLGLICQ